MTPPPRSSPAILVLLIVGILMVAIGREENARQDAPVPASGVRDSRDLDPRYFHPLPGRAPSDLNPADLAMQAKGVAAHRHVPLADVRRMLDEHTDGRASKPLGYQRVDLSGLNLALDEEWPIK